MNKELIEQAKKYKITLTEFASVSLPATNYDKNSAKEWIKVLQDFLDKHNLEDANIEIEMSGYDSYLDDIRVGAEVQRSEEAIRKNVEGCVANERFKKEEKKKNAKLRRENELRELARLKKKYET
jgi:hypothetical protein